MKTKIIYISGNECFEMADIRAAFEEVRAALGLDNDTVLFGVPVDADDAMAKPGDINVTENVAETFRNIESEETEIPDTDINAVPDDTTDIMPDIQIVANDILPDVTDNTEIPEVQISQDEIDIPKKKSRGRPKKITLAETEIAPESDSTTDDGADSAKVIPILSVLATQDDMAQPEKPETVTIESQPESDGLSADDIESIAEPVAIMSEPEPVITEISGTTNDIDIDTELVAPAMETNDTVEMQRVTLADMITDEVPPQTEATLEQLLERMTPLGEDNISVESMDDSESQSVEITEDIPSDDTDATLAQLANEFVEKQDTITAASRAENHGKIGKLKNILPFKKAKRDDNGLMGDLFGWAGIAANDEDFSMPGFFTGVASKK